MMLLDITKSLFRRPATEKYPFERHPAPERLRGRLFWDATKCTGCGLCAKDCPADAIKVIVLDRKAKRFVMEYHVDRCTYCAQCVHSCRQGCLTLSSDTWELSALCRDPFTLRFASDEADGEELSQPEGEGQGTGE
jgi:formate hydrogenlyase subunit 6/NADH:ubiquinone oxidoreductase subunit I